jgi:hypothetical protein
MCKQDEEVTGNPACGPMSSWAAGIPESASPKRSSPATDTKNIVIWLNEFFEAIEHCGMARTIGANRDQRPARLEKAAGAIGITRLSRQRRAASNGATATLL